MAPEPSQNNSSIPGETDQEMVALKEQVRGLLATIDNLNKRVILLESLSPARIARLCLNQEPIFSVSDWCKDLNKDQV